MTMARQLLGHQFQNGMATDEVHSISQNMSEGSLHFRSNWYLGRREIEDNSPSRKDGIDLKKEIQLRRLYCSFLQDVGMKLKVPQETIATAMMLCHRFFLRQSHAKNEWQTIATVSMFLAGKVEETPRLLMDVVVVAYEMMYRRDPIAAQRIKQKEVYEKQKELIVVGETLLLCTIGFDLDIQLPYKLLIAGSKKLKIAQNVWKVAWSHVNDWLRTTLCLEYKPHYIAAGSIFLAAKFHKVKLPSEKGMVWWQQFDVAPQQLEEVIQRMIKVLDQKRTEVPCTYEKARHTPVVPEKAASTSTLSSVLSGSVVTSDSSHVHDKEVGVVTSANSVNPDLPCSRVLVYGDVHFAIQSHVQDKEIGVVMPANSVNSELPSSRDLADDDIHLASKGEVQCHMSECGSAHSVVEDNERFNMVTHDQAMPLESDQMVGGEIISVQEGLSEMDKDRIRAKLKRRRWNKAMNKMVAATCSIDDGDAWIERELENGIEAKAEALEKDTNKMAVATCSIDDDDAWIEGELENGIEVEAEPLAKKLRWCEVLN